MEAIVDKTYIDSSGIINLILIGSDEDGGHYRSKMRIKKLPNKRIEVTGSEPSILQLCSEN